ncbi:hypothetical protein [Paraburkholderia acidiphila]|uniref:WGR domain-containing protein n=1 Tax=Paraburkholderia acidiphila TaxID=2571747 RepID=A0A7Z2G1W3_9BURK|nr:hypothetical protein [Paraburkholderia acidiphila]QGZ53561.1 hypothetical protein FAZ97_00815 [Paraburkholderia acidiphila]
MSEQLFLYGVYAIHVHPLELQGARWDAEYQITHRDKAVQAWVTVGGNAGFDASTQAVDAARRQAIADIEHGAGIPKPHGFP